MKKDFYIIVPIDNIWDNSVRDLSLAWKFRNFWSSINGNDDLLSIKWQIRSLTNLRKWLVTRVNSIKTSLESIWIKAQELDKTETIKFLADYYNPTLESYTTIKSPVENYDLI